MCALWCVAVLSVGIVHAQAPPPGRGVNFFSKEREIELGQQLSAEFRKTAMPLDDAEVGGYVQRVGARLAAQFPPEWTYEFETVRGPSSVPTHEPAAFPGGFVFVSTDLILAARNEDEFAGMLAHAMAHVAARHATRLAAKSQIGLIGAPARGANGPALALHLGLLTFQRANEREADYLAVQAMSAAGYDPASLASYIERVQPAAEEGTLVSQPMPSRDQRVSAIRDAIGKLPRTHLRDQRRVRPHPGISEIPLKT